MSHWKVDRNSGINDRTSSAGTAPGQVIGRALAARGPEGAPHDCSGPRTGPPAIPTVEDATGYSGH